MDTFLYVCISIGVLLFIVFFIFAGFVDNADKVAKEKHAQLVQEIAQAKEDYETSLNQLKENPQDITLREQTLKLGRAYASLARNDSVTIFDEMALMNDLNAVAGSAVNSQAVSPKNASSEKSLEERLIKLQELKAQGLITEEEFEQKRSDILSDI